MTFILHNDPFPHIIGYNFFNEEDKKEIVDEMYWICKSNFMHNDTENAKKIINGEFISKSNKKAIFLLDLYKEIEISKIYFYMRNLLTNLNEFISDNKTNFLFENYFKKTNKVNFLFNYYESENYYESHTDASMFTLIWYHWKNKNSFDGGKLFFEDYNYTFNCEDNSFIIFPGVLNHEVTKILKINNEEKFSDIDGRYSSTIFLNL